MKKYLIITLQTILVTVCAMILRQVFYRLIIQYELPDALVPLIYWLLLFLAVWAPRPVIYIPLTVSVSFSLYMIVSFTEDSQNAVTGTLLNFILIIFFTETFKNTLNKLKRANKKLELERERANSATRQKDIFLAKMSHELRTPLNGIKGITELLLSSEECRNKVSYLEMTKEAAETLQFLIDDLLDISRIEMGLDSLEAKTFLLPQFMERVCRLFEVPAAKKNLDYSFILPENLPRCVNMDNHRLRQIISNLISNAIKYTDEGGSVSILAENRRTDDKNSVLNIKIVDTGKGIREDEKDLIFNSFYRAVDTCNTKTDGIGLGLYIVKRHLELFNGTIMVESTPGKGSTFTVDIPLVIDEAANCPEAGHTSIPDETADIVKLRILAAEDNRINAFFLVSLIEKFGHTLTLVDNGSDAVKKFMDNEYDLILMDIQMPGMSGIEAVSEIKSIEAESGRRHTYTAAITAYATDNDKREIEQHFDFYITKPFDSGKFLNLLRSVTRALTDFSD